MLQNVTGQAVDYDAFKSEFDTNPSVKNVVDKFDADGITLKTKNKPEPTVGGEVKKTGKVDAMAKRAAAKALG